ncbi:MAG: endonuclease/exonuclease/phosphatase family protein [Terriglobia bacterium]
MNSGVARVFALLTVLGLGAGLLALPLATQAPTPEAPLEPELGNLLPDPDAGVESLRLVSFNVHKGEDIPALAKTIRNTPDLCDADIFLVQEIESHPSEGTSRTRKLAEALELNYVYAPARRTDTGGTHGLAILSRFPLSGVKIIPLPQFSLRFNTRRRIALAATVAVGDRSLRLYNLHLDTRLNTKDRLAQLRPVVEAARAHPASGAGVGGDFNTNPSSCASRDSRHPSRKPMPLFIVAC